MNVHQFNEIIEARIAETKKLLIEKAKEYASDGDRLHNFKRGAEISGLHPLLCWLGYTTKHLTSVIDLIHDVAEGKDSKKVEVWREKVGDCIVYFHLLEALLVEHATDKKLG